MKRINLLSVLVAIVFFGSACKFAKVPDVSDAQPDTVDAAPAQDMAKPAPAVDAAPDAAAPTPAQDMPAATDAQADAPTPLPVVK